MYVILCLAELKHACLDGGHLAIQIGSQSKLGLFFSLFTNLHLFYMKAASKDLIFI